MLWSALELQDKFLSQQRDGGKDSSTFFSDVVSMDRVYRVSAKSTGSSIINESNKVRFTSVERKLCRSRSQ